MAQPTSQELLDKAVLFSVWVVSGPCYTSLCFFELVRFCFGVILSLFRFGFFRVLVFTPDPFLFSSSFRR